MKAYEKSKPYHLCFETLANELRIKIIKELKKEPMPVEEIAKRVNAERSTVSHSLRMLRDCNYVDVQKKGKERIYSLKRGAFEAMQSASRSGSVFQILDQHIECFCQNECKKTRV